QGSGAAAGPELRRRRPRGVRTTPMKFDRMAPARPAAVAPHGRISTPSLPVRTAMSDMPALAAVDPQIHQLIQAETRRQDEFIRLIPSENYASLAVMEATGSILTNKYPEGYPGRRYYEGHGYVDQIETIAIERAKALFG